MAGFGVPKEQLDAPERAVDSAREMLDRFGGLAGEWRKRHGIETGIGIGINAGEVIAGNVGSAAYTSYTIIGDTVNVAARLSQRARAGEALFSSAVKRSLDEHGHSVPVIELPALAAARPRRAGRDLLHPGCAARGLPPAGLSRPRPAHHSSAPAAGPPARAASGCATGPAPGRRA